MADGVSRRAIQPGPPLPHGSLVEASVAARAPAEDLQLSGRTSIHGSNRQPTRSQSASLALCKQEVAGSIPAGSTVGKCCKHLASRLWGSGRRRFRWRAGVHEGCTGILTACSAPALSPREEAARAPESAAPGRGAGAATIAVWALLLSDAVLLYSQFGAARDGDAVAAVGRRHRWWLVPGFPPRGGGTVGSIPLFCAP